MSLLRDLVSKELKLSEGALFSIIDQTSGVDLTHAHSDEPVSEERTKKMVRILLL